MGDRWNYDLVRTFMRPGRNVTFEECVERTKREKEFIKQKLHSIRDTHGGEFYWRDSWKLFWPWETTIRIEALCPKLKEPGCTIDEAINSYDWLK